MTLSASELQLLGSDLYSYYPNTIVFQSSDINSDNVTDIIFILISSDNKPHGLAVYRSSDNVLLTQPQIVGSDFFAQFLNGSVTLHDLNGDYKKDLLFVGRASAGGPLQKLAFYPYLSDGYPAQPEIIASDLLALYPKVGSFYSFENPNHTTTLVIPLLSDSIEGVALYDISDHLFSSTPTIIGRDFHNICSDVYLSSIQCLNSDIYPDLIFRLTVPSTPFSRTVGLGIFMSLAGHFSDNPDIIGLDLCARYPVTGYTLHDFQKNGNQDIFFTFTNNQPNTLVFGISRISDGHYANQPYNLVEALMSDYPWTQPLVFPMAYNTVDFIFVQLRDNLFQSKGWAFLDLRQPIDTLSFQRVASDLFSAHPLSSNTLTWLNAAGELSIGIQLTDSDYVTHGLAIYAPSDRNYTHPSQILGSDINSTLYHFSYFEFQSNIYVNGFPVIRCTLQDEDSSLKGIIFYAWSDGLFREIMEFSNSALLSDFPDTVLQSVFQTSDQIVAILNLGYDSTTHYFNGLIMVYEHPTSAYPNGYQLIDGHTVPLNEFSTLSMQELNNDELPEIMIDSRDTSTSPYYEIIFDFSDRRYNPFPRFTEADGRTPSSISYSCRPTLSDIRFYSLSSNAFKITGYQSNNLSRQRFVSVSYLSQPVQTQSFNSDGFFEFGFTNSSISDGASITVTLYQEHCFRSDQKTIIATTQSSAQGEFNLRSIGSLLDFSLALPPALSAALSMTNDVHIILSDICAYAHAQPGETFIAGLVVKETSDLFCSNAIITTKPHIVDISCSGDTLSLNETNGYFSFNIDYFMSDGISIRYSDVNCQVSDNMSVVGGGFTIKTSDANLSTFVWVNPSQASDALILINSFANPLVTIDAQGHIESIGGVGPQIAHNTTSDLVYASFIKASAMKLGMR